MLLDVPELLVCVCLRLLDAHATAAAIVPASLRVELADRMLACFRVFRFQPEARHSPVQNLVDRAFIDPHELVARFLAADPSHC